MGKRPKIAKIALIIFITIYFAGIASGCGQKAAPRTEQAFLLDTVVTVTYYSASDREAVLDALALCKTYERVFSRTDPESELFRLNAQGGGLASPELREVLALALDCCEASGGRYDITLGAVSALYDFSGEPHRPDDADLAAALSHVGWEKISIEGDTVTLTDPAAVVDLGSVAKGWIADRMQERLEERGVHIPIRHVCDGGGTLAFPEMHLDMTRPGTPLYGMLSGEPHSMDDLQDPLQPAIVVKTRLASVRRVPKGTKVGYGATWEAPKASTIGVLPLGFVDGVARQAAGRGWVLVQGIKCPIIGRVCMDQLMIDLSDVSDPKFGEEVVVMGEQNGAKIDILEAGDFAGTSDTEFSCRLGRRLPIRYVGKLAKELGYAE